MEVNKVYQGDALEVLKSFPSGVINCCVTSPPYWGLRDYGVPGQLGLESMPEEYINNLVNVFREVKRVLKDDGTLWLNLGDSYAGGGNGGHIDNKAANGVKGRKINNTNNLKTKNLIGIPWRVALALQEDGWYLRSDIIWHKPNAMPESVKDRPTKAHEYIFLLSKNPKYYYDSETIKEPTLTKDNIKPFKNKRTVWNIATKPFKDAHFAVFPPDLIKPCILAGCPENGIILDPFIGSGTTALVAKENNRNWVGIELNKQYITEIISKRLG